MKGFLRVGASALMLLILSASAFAEDGTDHPMHATIFGGKAILDEDRPTDNGDIFWGVGIGRFLGDRFSLDLEYDSVYAKVDQGALQAAFPGATFDEWNLKTYGLTGRLYFSDQWSVRPFAAFGLTYTDHRSIFDEDGALGWQAGIGVDGALSNRWSGRFQAMYRNDRDDTSLRGEANFDDVLVTLGLTYHWGGKAAPPPPPPAEPVDGDADGDGVPDSRDRCPNTPRGTAVDEYGCPLDSDGDGVLNARDKCPNTPPGTVVDLDGCPEDTAIDLPGVNFEFDSAQLKPESIEVLERAVDILRKHPGVKFEVAGHTDSVGSDAYNQGLSERRAQSVMTFLASRGIDASRMTSKGYGESRPIASNETDAGRAKNRRTELVIQK